MAHKKAGGSTKNGRDSAGQRRGVKMFGGEQVRVGNIIVRQVGSRYHAGDNVGTGKETTVLAVLHLVERAAGREARIVFKPGTRGEIARSAGDIGRIAQEIGWRPATRLIDGIKRIISTV